VGPQGINPIKPKNAFLGFLVPKSLKQHFRTLKPKKALFSANFVFIPKQFQYSLKWESKI
jgi:hypothetical protein